MQLLWFKRDLRVQDHAALSQAAARGPVLPLYVVEPQLWAQPDMAARHWEFIAESLQQLRTDLAALGQPLIVRVGPVTQVFDGLCQSQPISDLWSHLETGNGWTYDRDRAVARWCRDKGLPWHQMPNHGVRRAQASRDGWAKAWDVQMAQPQSTPPPLAPIDLAPGAVPTAADLGLAPDPCPARQPGGRNAGQERLHSFLHTRGALYRKAMSSPLTAAEACSRLSPHLAWGTLSMREVAQATWTRQRQLRADPKPGSWRGALSSFSGRLHWHCHFMQKLEDEPRLEFENLHRGHDGMRPSAPDHERLALWARGETGLPFVDACMRYLQAGGWLNFRMRAMVMAVASYHLWLDWRAPGLQLARSFTDYEPGIHWSQVQMQAGTTGINAVRIYNPIKQGLDQDPSGVFTRRWLPELNAIEDRFLQQPWLADNAGSVLGRAYPHPVVDHLQAAREAKERIWAVRRSAGFKTDAAQIVNRHGSRKGRPRRAKPRKGDGQMELPL